MSVSSELRDKIERISNLPTLPQVATRLLHLVNDPDTRATEVALLIEQDISLSAKVIRLANSVFYGAPRQIGSIQTAVVRLGFKVINTIVLSLTVFDMFPAGRNNARFDRKAFWRHCVRCATMAKLLAKQQPRAGIDPEEVFCGGLLHDIGRIVMEQYLHEDLGTALDYAKHHDLALYAAESKVLGYTHTDVAAWLTSRWDLPDSLNEPIINHHSPAIEGQSSYHACLCHIADYLCYSPLTDCPDRGKQPSLMRQAFIATGIHDTDIEKIQSKFKQELDSMELFLELMSGK